jgi:hypothetical protein
MSGPELRLRLNRMTWRRVDDAIVVLDLHNSTYLSINGTGALIWEQLVVGATIEKMTRSITDQFDVDETVAKADIEAFTDDLRVRLFLQ